MKSTEGKKKESKMELTGHLLFIDIKIKKKHNRYFVSFCIIAMNGDKSTFLNFLIIFIDKKGNITYI
jgi:hypothetical protein